jgi:hypothetical protein
VAIGVLLRVSYANDATAVEQAVGVAAAKALFNEDHVPP